MHFVATLNFSVFLLLKLSKKPVSAQGVCNEIHTHRLSKIYHTASKYWMSLVGFSGTYYNRCIIFNNPQKKKRNQEKKIIISKYEDGIFFKMCEMFRIRIQPMMLRTLWNFQHWYVQRMSSIDLLAGWGGSSGTGAQVLKLLCPSENHSPKMQPAVPLWNITVVFRRLPHLRLFISNCENGFHFWWSGQWSVSRHLRPSGWTGTSPQLAICSGMVRLRILFPG